MTYIRLPRTTGRIIIMDHDPQHDRDQEFTLRIARGAAALAFATDLADQVDKFAQRREEIERQYSTQLNFLNDTFATIVRSRSRDLRNTLESLTSGTSDDDDDGYVQNDDDV